VRPVLAGAWAALALLSTSCAAAGTGSDPGAPPTGATDDEVAASPAEAGDLVIAGASDLNPAFTLLGEMFEEETGTDVVFDFGSSGQIAQRIIEGQPVDLFASANAGFVDQVVDAEVGDPGTRLTYAFGRIVLWADDARWRDWDTIEAAVADDEVRNFAIANPEHAPYGMAGRQALVAAGVLDAVDERLVLGENVSDTQRLIETGNADVGIIALSLAIAADERDVGEWSLIDASLHEPLQQDLVVTTDDPERAARAAEFVAFVASEDGREVMRRFGFLLPGEELDG
jgi:molybdate transport system substrate-binding protein